MTNVSNRRAEDPAQTDTIWAGYHPRAMAPLVLLALVASLLVWTGRWFLDDLSELADRAGALAVFAIAWCLWPGLAALFLYRTITYTYRVTDRAVLIDFGFLSRPIPPVWLKDITEVVPGTGWISRLLGVGWVQVRTPDRVVELWGVQHPKQFAEFIRAAAHQASKSQRSALAG